MLEPSDLTEVFLVPRDQTDLSRRPPLTKAMRSAWAYTFSESRQGWRHTNPGDLLSYSEFAELGFPRMRSIPSVRDYRNLWVQAMIAGLVPAAIPNTLITVSDQAIREFFYDKARGIRKPHDQRDQRRRHGNARCPDTHLPYHL